MNQSRFEKSMEMHKIHSRITFKEIKETNTDLIVRVTQGRSPAANYASKDELDTITRDLYKLKSDFNKELIVHTVPYQPPPSDVVTPEWIQKKMHEHGIGLKTLEADLAITKSDLSGMINGHKEMGVRTQNMFYWYFRGKELVELSSEMRTAFQALVESSKLMQQQLHTAFVESGSLKQLQDAIKAIQTTKISIPTKDMISGGDTKIFQMDPYVKK